MKLKLINTVKIAMVAIAYLFLVTSCNDNAPTPNDETTDKGHGEWYKIEFKFTEGHIHGHGHQHNSGETFFHGAPAFGKYLKTEQTYTFERTKDGVKPSGDVIRLIGQVAYGLEIIYYSKSNEVMSHEFTTSEMSPIHQHFFIPKNIKSIKDGVPTEKMEHVFEYTYRDTNPWNGMFGDNEVTLRPKDDPIGLKGFFEVEKPYQAFDLNVILVHVIAGSKLDDNGVAYPFNKPSSRVMGTQDLNLKIPVRIFTKYPVTDAEMQNFYDDIVKEFDITKDEAQKEWNSRKNIDYESGKYKL